MTPAKARLRLLSALALLLLPLSAYALGGRAGQGTLGFDATALPDTIGDRFGGPAAPLAPDVAEQLGAASYVMRPYSSVAGGAPVWVYLAAYSGRSTTGAHDPSVCYPAQGWDLRAIEHQAIQLGDRGSLSASRLLASRGGAGELVLYWFQPVGRWPQAGPEEQLLRALDGFMGRPQYVFARLSVALGEDVDVAEEQLLRVARGLAPWIRAALEATTNGSRAARSVEPPSDWATSFSASGPDRADVPPSSPWEKSDRVSVDRSGRARGATSQP